MFNAYRLANRGIKICAKGIKKSCRSGYNVIPNFYPEFIKDSNQGIKETLDAVKIYQDILGEDFWALEFNLSCPNMRKKVDDEMEFGLECVKRIKRVHPDLVLITKTSILHPIEFSQELERVGADVLHWVNTIPYNIIFPDKKSPLHAVGGGAVSGHPAFWPAFIHHAANRPKVRGSVIMGCGIGGLDDAEKYFGICANAVSCCTLAARDPAEACRIIEIFLKGEE